MAELGPSETNEAEALIHASAVEINGRALMILGAPGRGKSALCLSLIALGAALIGDDRIRLTRVQDQIMARGPHQLAGLIEAWGIGILEATPSRALEGVPVAVVVDLDQREDKRLPPARETNFLGVDVPLVLGQDSPHFPAALRQLVIKGRHA